MAKQLELEQSSREEARREKEAAEERRRQQAAEEVDVAIKAEKARIRKFAGVMAGVLSSLLALLSWSYSVVKEAQEKEIVDTQRKTRVDIELKANADAAARNASNLAEHTTEFEEFRHEQEKNEQIRQLEELHQTQLLEKTLRQLGTRPPQRSAKHKQAARSAGWDIED